tara:strand:- start:250 stop:7872 length:7623 start_codon:yes stop_codon:yes gene_type:complete
MPENNKYSQYTQGMTETQAAEFVRMAEIYDNRFQGRAPTPGMARLDADDLKLSDYDQEIQKLLGNDQFSAIESEAQRRAMNKILELNDIEPGSFFEKKPDATALDVMRATNFNGFSDKEKRYADPNSFTYESGRKKAQEDLENEYNSTFQNSFLFPEMGGQLNELLPDYIKNDAEKRAQFEKAFYYESGGAKIDFDESGRVGDIHTDNVVGNFARSVGMNASNLANEIADGALGTANALYDLFGGDLEQADKEFLSRQKSREVESEFERTERGLSEGVGFSDPIFWASFSSPEARRQLYSSSKVGDRTVDFQAMMDRGGVTEATAGEMWGNSIDQLLQSAPLIMDLAGGQAIAKGLLKGVTKKVSTAATRRVAGKAISNEAAEKIAKQAAKTNSYINQAGGFVMSDLLVASQMHSDNVGQEWYDNLNGGERFNFLAIQSSAEVVSGMVLNRVMGRGFGKGSMTQNIFKGKKSAISEWGKNIARSTFIGIGEEALAEAGTAAVQYHNEIYARQAGGDETAYYDEKELKRRVYESATAGVLMGGAGGMISGTIGGGAQAAMAKYSRNVIESNKEAQAAAEAFDAAVTATGKKKAMDRLDKAVKKHSGAQTAIARAYEKLSKQNPEAFKKIAKIQGKVNALVEVYKELAEDGDDAWKEGAKKEITALLQEKQQLENEAFEGDQTLDAVIKEELEALSKEREGKVEAWEQSKRESPEAQAEKLMAEESEAQNASLEAAIAVNSAEQSADDDVQDAPEGQPTQKQPTQEKKSNKAEDLPEGSKNQEGKVGEPLDTMAIDSPRYREIAEKANVLLKSFKGVVGNVVIHTTAESFQKATNKDPEKTKGAITHRGAQKSTVHINLSHSNANLRTVRHEFLHAAFLGKSFKAKKALLKELQSVVKRYGDTTADFGEGETITLKELIARIEQAYEGNEDIVEETVVNALEYFLNQDIFSTNPSLGQRILNAWNSFFGSAVEKSDLEGFVQAFRDAESGKDFDVDLDKAQEAANQDRDMESRDLGPSRAYPDLQNSEVSYWIRNVNKMGGDMYNREQKVFKDYWHFRNWWAQETGNGKKASMIGGFEYIGKDGKKKTVNEPKPKVDRNTGEIVDMKPRLKTFNEWKKERLDKNTESRRQRINVETITNFIGFDVLKFIDNEFGRTTGIYDFEARPTQVPEGFDTDETFEFSGDQSMSYKSLKKAQREAEDLVTEIARAIPPNQRGKFMFRVTEKSKGVAQVELLSDSPGLYAQLKEAADAELDLDDSVSVFGGLESIDDIKSNGDAIAGGEVKTLESVVLEDLKISKSNNLGKDVNRGSVYELNGLLCRAFGYDRTKINSGVRNLFDRADKAVTAHKSKQDAENVFLSLREMAATVIREKGLKVGEIGYIATMQTLLGEESTLGNPNVFLDIINGKEGYFNVDSVGKALNRKGTGKNKAKFTGKTQKFRAKILQGLAVGDNQSLKDIQNAIRNDGDILLTQESLDVIKEILEDSSEDLSFKDRTAIANSFLDSSQKELIYAKHNDSVWANVGLAETVSYTIIPFKYEGETENGNIKISGFNTDIDQNKKSAFKGLIVYEPLTDSEGNDVPPPKIKVPKEAANLAQLFPNLKIAIEEDGELSQKKISELTPKEQTKAVSTRAGISAVKGKVDITEPENKTRIQVSLDLSAPLEGTDSTLPFEPNRLNSFEAFMARMDQLFANKYANVMRLQKDIQKGLGKAVALSQDFINAETLLYGKTANDLAELDEKVKAISKELKEKGLTSDEVTEYLIARHAVERNALIKERNGEENGSGMTDEDAALVLNMPAEKKAKLESIAKKIDAIQKDTRDTMRKYGLETDERVDAWEAMFENYVPLGGLAIDDLNVESTIFPTGGAGISIYGDTTKKAKGRKSMAVNVLAQVVAQNAAIHVKARKNEALSSLYNLVKKNPSPRVWAIKKEVSVDSQNAVGVRIDGEQKFIVFNDPSYAKSLKNMGVEKLDVMSKLLRVPAAWLRRSFTTANPEFIISNFARDIQSALFNGLAESEIPGGLIQGRHIAAKVISRVKSTLPALIKGTFGKDLDPEMQAYFDEFKEDGGQTGWGFVKSLDQIAKEIEAESTEPGKVKQATKWMAKNSIDVIENLNDAFENSIRLAAYIEARKSGVSREKAAELAKNITVNFNRSGELGPVANAWYLFFNASVQGTARLARSLGTLKDVRKPNGELESWHKRLNASQKLAFGLSLTSGMLAAVNIAMSDEDEDGVLFYNKIPDYEKERNLIFMYDGEHYFKVPLPYGFNVMSNLGTAMAEVAGGHREMTEATMFIANSAFSSFSPISFGQSENMAKYITKAIIPTVVKPLVEIATNETYFGSSVYREQFPVGAPKPDSELAFRSPEAVQQFFSWMNKATGGSAQVPGSVDINPDQFWYGLEYYIGGAGQFVTRSLGTGRDMFEMMKEGKKIKMAANDFPFIRKLYGEVSKYYDSDKYTENTDLISQLYKERKESDDKKSDRYSGVTKLESMRKSTEKKLKLLRKKRKEAREIENYVDKQNRMQELYEKERSLLMEFNKAFEKLRGE